LAAELLVELLQFPLAVGTCGQGDGPVGMQVIDVREGKEGMQRGIDRRRYAIFPECRERVVADHLVFVLLSPIQLLQLLEAIQVKKSEAGLCDRANIAAAAFYGKDTDRLAGEGK